MFYSEIFCHILCICICSPSVSFLGTIISTLHPLSGYGINPGSLIRFLPIILKRFFKFLNKRIGILYGSLRAFIYFHLLKVIKNFGAQTGSICFAISYLIRCSQSVCFSISRSCSRRSFVSKLTLIIDHRFISDFNSAIASWIKD